MLDGKKQSQIFFEHFSKQKEEYQACAALVREHWKEETAHILRVANDVKNQIFLFDLPWDMEQTNEPVTFQDEIIWDDMPDGDPEFIYQMNRHRYWICLGQAYRLTEDEDYAQCFVKQLIHWIETVPLCEEARTTTWRTLEMGLRGMYWVKAMSYFEGSLSLTEDVMERFFDSLRVHGEFLFGWDAPFSEKSNWGVLENAGLYVIGKALNGTEEGERFEKKALERLERQIQIQVMGDGMHWEQSIMYHNEVMMCYMEVLRTARLWGEDVLSEEKAIVHRMAIADRMMMKPDGRQPMNGDSDDTSLRDVVTACAYFFSDPVLKSGGYSVLDYESIWDYGTKAEEEYEKLCSEIPDLTCYQLEDSGHLFLRSGWGEDADYFHLVNGSLGGGHGHMDKLHIDMSAYGEDILVDSGRFTYIETPKRYELKSASAHNTVTIDQMEYTECDGSWNVIGLPLSTPNRMVQKGKFTYFEGGHAGYQKQGIGITRRVIAIGTSCYLIQDTTNGTGFHSMTQHFHFPETGHIFQREEGWDYIGNRVKACFYSFSSENAVELEKEKSSLSRHYNTLNENEKMLVTSQGENAHSLTTVIFSQRKEENQECSVQICEIQNPSVNRILTRKEAEGFLITIGTVQYLIMTAHVDAGSFCEYIGANGIYGLGRVMACEVRGKNSVPCVLRW